jgi:hypothetical protein
MLNVGLVYPHETKSATDPPPSPEADGCSPELGPGTMRQSCKMDKSRSSSRVTGAIDLKKSRTETRNG